MRIMKRIAGLLAVIAAVIALIALPLKTKAANAYVFDEAGVLSAEDLARLNNMAEEITNRQECGVYVVITSDQHGYSERAYAQGIFMNYGLGYGDPKGVSGVLLAIAYDESYYDSVAYGAASDVFTTTRLDVLNDKVYDGLSSGDWAGACESFIYECDRILTNTNYHYYIPNYTDNTISQNVVQSSAAERRAKWFGSLPFAGVFSGLIGFFSVLVMKGKNKNTGEAVNADRYIVKNGVNLKISNDQFLNVTRTVTRIPRNSGGGGGGSPSYHSSGFSHSSGGHHF